jgi:hypothetical protein
VAELARNRWPNSTEMGGRFDPKWVAEFNRNTQPTGILSQISLRQPMSSP